MSSLMLDTVETFEREAADQDLDLLQHFEVDGEVCRLYGRSC